MRMIQTGLLLAGLVLATSMPAAAQSADDAFGVWLHPENGSHIRVAKCSGGKLCATVIKPSEPGKTDVNNPDPALQDRKIKGLTLMSGAEKSGETTWSGQLYNPNDGQVYQGTITVVSQDKMKLEGCVLGGIICQGPTWTRIQ